MTNMRQTSRVLRSHKAQMQDMKESGQLPSNKAAVRIWQNSGPAMVEDKMKILNVRSWNEGQHLSSQSEETRDLTDPAEFSTLTKSALQEDQMQPASSLQRQHTGRREANPLVSWS